MTSSSARTFGFGIRLGCLTRRRDIHDRLTHIAVGASDNLSRLPVSGSPGRQPVRPLSFELSPRARTAGTQAPGATFHPGFVLAPAVNDLIIFPRCRGSIDFQWRTH